jgi:hypothetical protein
MINAGLTATCTDCNSAYLSSFQFFISGISVFLFVLARIARSGCHVYSLNARRYGAVQIAAGMTAIADGHLVSFSATSLGEGD